VGKLDLSREELEAKVVEPYRELDSINLAGRRISPDEIEQIQIRVTDETAEEIRPRALRNTRVVGVPVDFEIFSEGRDVTDEILEPLPARSSTHESEDAQLSEQVRALLQQVWEYFKTNNRWPSTRELDAFLSRTRGVELPSLASQLPPGLLWPDLSQFRPGWEPDQQEVRLTISGLSEVPGTEEEQHDLVAIVAEVARRAAEYEPKSADDYLTASSQELGSTLDLSPDSMALRVVFDLIVGGLPGFWRGGGSNPDGWSFTVNERGARRYEGVSTISELLERMEQITQSQRAEMTRLSLAFSPTPAPPAEDMTASTPDQHAAASALLSSDEAGDPQKVFLVYGRNTRAKEAIEEFLRSIGLSIVDFEEAVAATGSASPYTGEALDAGFSLARAILVLITPDERAHLRQELAASPTEALDEYQARPNVFFEAGMAFRTQRRRTVIVQLGHVRPFSDIGGVHFVPLDDSPDARQKLIGRLRIAGCAVQLPNEDWRTAGAFMDSVQFPAE
jgi:predicted nucleotide-binding protein